MYTTSEDAIEDNAPVSLAQARRELARHQCRIVATFTDAPHGGEPTRITVTNDLDEPEEIECTTKAILEWLGY
jgi:hypothetical protein